MRLCKTDSHITNEKLPRVGFCVGLYLKIIVPLVYEENIVVFKLTKGPS